MRKALTCFPLSVCSNTEMPRPPETLWIHLRESDEFEPQTRGGGDKKKERQKEREGEKNQQHGHVLKPWPSCQSASSHTRLCSRPTLSPSLPITSPKVCSIISLDLILWPCCPSRSGKTHMSLKSPCPAVCPVQLAGTSFIYGLPVQGTGEEWML